jgi:YesN/AraC family two-component response regulator
MFRTSGHAGKARCEPGWSWHPAPLTDFDLWYVVEGTGRIAIDSELYPVRKGNCFLLQPGNRVQAEQDLRDRLLVIYIHFQMEVEEEAGVTEILPNPDVCTVIDDTYRFEYELHRLLESNVVEEQYHDVEFDLWMKLVWLRLLRIGERRRTDNAFSFKHRQLVHFVIDHIRSHIGEPISYKHLADLVELSPRYLSGLFKRYTGYSLKEYVTRLRMDRAKVLLTETTMSVTQIAEAVGYADIYFFSKLFKSLHGEPPSYFRRFAHHAEKH